MKRFVLALLLSSFTLSGAIADPTCHDKATDKKLAGAALASFVKKCEADAKSTCDAAKTAFSNKCMRDATGT